MAVTKISNFSIDHILGTEVGQPCPAGAESLHNNVRCFGLPGGLGLRQDLSNCNLNYMPRPLATVSLVPVLPHTSFDYNSYLGYGSYNYQRHHHHHDLIYYPNTAVGLRLGLNNERGSQMHHHLGQPSSSQRQRGRVRTVFTDSQTARLEQQFQITDYPSVETRADLASNTGLTEETVRVWFKNRRARRKRQKSGKVKSPADQSELEDGHEPFNRPLPRALR